MNFIRRIGDSRAKIAGIFIFLLAAQTLAVGLFHLHYHEPWRDEVQHVLLAQKNVGFHELIRALRYEGHPPLLHLLYKVLFHLAEPREVLALTAAAGYFALGAATFSTAVALIPPFSAFVFSLAASWTYAAVYELGVISRGYGLGLALALAGLAFWIWNEKRPSFIFHSLGVLALVASVHTSVHAAILALCIAMPYLIYWVAQRETGRILRAVLPLGVAMVCLVLIVRDHPSRMVTAVAVPATPTAIGTKVIHANRAWGRGEHVPHLFKHVTILFQEYGYPTNWWPSDVSLLLKRLGGSAFLALIVLTLLQLLVRDEHWRERVLILSSMIFAIGVYDFFLRYLYPGNFRHQIFLLHPLFLLCALFWMRELPRVKRAGRATLGARAQIAMAYGASASLHILFVFQWSAGAAALAADAKAPFSGTAVIRTAIPDLETSLIAVDIDAGATPLALWLPRARFYSTMGNGREFSYVVWDKSRHERQSRRTNLFQRLCQRTLEDPHPFPLFPECLPVGRTRLPPEGIGLGPQPPPYGRAR